MFGYVVDGILILLAFLLIWNGYRKGILKTIIKLGLYAGAVVLAKLLTNVLTPVLQKILPMPGIGTKLSSYLNINIDKISEGGLMELLVKWGFSDDAATAIQNFFDKTAVTAGDSLSRQLTPAVDTLLTSAIVFVFLLVVLFLVAMLLSNIFDNALELPIISTVNHILGLAAGLIAAALVLFVAQLVISWTFPLIDASLDLELTETIAERSFMLKLIQRINPLQGLLSGYLK